MSEILQLSDGSASSPATTTTTTRPATTRAGRIRIAPADFVATASFLALAVFVLGRQWKHLGDGYLIRSGQDQTMWEWSSRSPRTPLANFENPLSSTLQNYPLGVNLMANTAMFGVSVPLAPSRSSSAPP